MNAPDKAVLALIKAVRPAIRQVVRHDARQGRPPQRMPFARCQQARFHPLPTVLSLTLPQHASHFLCCCMAAGHSTTRSPLPAMRCLPSMGSSWWL